MISIDADTGMYVVNIHIFDIKWDDDLSTSGPIYVMWFHNKVINSIKPRQPCHGVLIYKKVNFTITPAEVV